MLSRQAPRDNEMETPGTLDLLNRPCVGCGQTLRQSETDPAVVACSCGRSFPRHARYIYTGACRVVHHPERRAPEPPALQGALEGLHERGPELAAVKDRERAIRAKLDDRATGPGLIEWIERQALVEPQGPTLEDVLLAGVVRRYEGKPLPKKITRRARPRA